MAICFSLRWRVWDALTVDIVAQDLVAQSCGERVKKGRECCPMATRANGVAFCMAWCDMAEISWEWEEPYVADLSVCAFVSGRDTCRQFLSRVQCSHLALRRHLASGRHSMKNLQNLEMMKIVGVGGEALAFIPERCLGQRSLVCSIISLEFNPFW